MFTSHVIANSNRVPFTAGDLACYAMRLYDDYVADPALIRLIVWKRLERLSTGYLHAGLQENDAAHLRDIEQQQRTGAIRSDIDPAEVWSLLVLMASTWAQTSITAVAGGSDPGPVHQRRRTALAAAVISGLCVP